MTEETKQSKTNAFLRLALVAVVLALAALVLWFGFLKSRFSSTSVNQTGTSQSIQEIQTAELNRLREESGWTPLNAEQIKEQKAQLENLRQKDKPAVLSEDEIKKQLEDLNKLRSSQ